MEKEIVHELIDVSKLGGIGIGVVVTIFGVGRYFQSLTSKVDKNCKAIIKEAGRIDNVDERVDELEKTGVSKDVSELKKEFRFLKDQTLQRYLTKEDHIKSCTMLNSSVESQIKALNDRADKDDAERDHAREKLSAELAQINKSITILTTKIEHNV